MNADPHEIRVRLAAFHWLEEQASIHDDILPWSLLIAGFVFEGQRIPLVSMQGIFEPKRLKLPVSLRTSNVSPYDDAFGADGLLRYAYRGTDPDHPDNVGLRDAQRLRMPLVYFHAVSEGRYVAAWPVFVVGDEPMFHHFRIAVDDAKQLPSALAGPQALRDPVSEASPRRAYLTAVFRVRLHQRAFRERVIRAYREHCALCRLRHSELLDAAHIVPDVEDQGEPVLPNGLALCKLHHAAFDRHFLTVRPDYVIGVRRQILEEEDGPMLVHGLKAMHGLQILVPRDRRERPDPERLAWRYERFRRTG